jgi:hypothetical protein
MTLMRTAIVGKDDEKFLGDQDSSTALKASAETPAKPSTPPPVGKPLVHSVLQAQPVQVKAAATVKPALNSAQVQNKLAHKN